MFSDQYFEFNNNNNNNNNKRKEEKKKKTHKVYTFLLQVLGCFKKCDLKNRGYKSNWAITTFFCPMAAF